MSFLDHIRACNRFDRAEFIPFLVDDERVGLIRPAFARHLARWPGLFAVDDRAVSWCSPLVDLKARTQALGEVLATLVGEGLIDYLHGERYPVTAGDRRRPKMLIDRACAPLFGVRAFGQHLNGYVRTGDGLALWVARRALTRRVYPGYLDNLVGGGVPHGVSLAENLRKECDEEAGIPAALVDCAVPVGAVTYCRDSAQGLKPDVMYCYDLELPTDFTPRCRDGEVEAFYLWPLEQVLETVRDSDAFKLNCNLVIIDFLIRHGYLGQDDPDYLELLWGLHTPLP